MDKFYELIKKENHKLVFMDKTITDIEILKNSCKTKHIMELLCFCVQEKVCRAIENFESKTRFKIDRWAKPNNNGGGVSCVIEEGEVFEKGGVNVSVITGELTAQNIAQMQSRGYIFDKSKKMFSAVGISSVIHPKSPLCATMHFNYRYFEVFNEDDDSAPIWWFGGGCDITPFYVVENNIVHFHKTLKKVCDAHDLSYYPKFKKWADDYFYIPHREERRGLGGIFFDDLTAETADPILEFVFDCAFAVVPAYLPTITSNKDITYDQQKRDWQLIRRGRYVEFNIMYDRGTKFGLAVPGSRVESILMSLPPYASWKYDYAPDAHTPEGKLLQLTKTPREWAE